MGRTEEVISLGSLHAKFDAFDFDNVASMDMTSGDWMQR